MAYFRSTLTFAEDRHNSRIRVFYKIKIGPVRDLRSNLFSYRHGDYFILRIIIMLLAWGALCLPLLWKFHRKAAPPCAFSEFLLLRLICRVSLRCGQFKLFSHAFDVVCLANKHSIARSIVYCWNKKHICRMDQL